MQPTATNPEIDALAELVRHTPEGGAVVVPRSLAAAIISAALEGPASPHQDGGSGPGGDFTARDLQRRFRRSPSWVREQMSSGAFGRPYYHGRERIAHRAEVLAYEGRLRSPATDSESHRESPAPSRPVASPVRRRLSAGSLTERRRRG